MKLNLGCGVDYRQGYTNVDFAKGLKLDQQVDLSRFPWPFQNGSADEILMLDFLEHFSYHTTDKILLECWRVLKTNGTLVIQVPDFEHCALAALGGLTDRKDWKCNICGEKAENFSDPKIELCRCKNCGTPWNKIADAAIRRLYGGQDREGNWHYTAFTKLSLVEKLHKTGFNDTVFLEEEHQWANWNFKISARKDDW